MWKCQKIKCKCINSLICIIFLQDFIKKKVFTAFRALYRGVMILSRNDCLPSSLLQLTDSSMHFLSSIPESSNAICRISNPISLSQCDMPARHLPYTRCFVERKQLVWNTKKIEQTHRQVLFKLNFGIIQNQANHLHVNRRGFLVYLLPVGCIFLNIAYMIAEYKEMSG